MQGLCIPVRPDAQRAGADGAGIDLVETGNHEICSGRTQQGLVAEAGDAERRHATGSCGLDARGRILDY